MRTRERLGAGHVAALICSLIVLVAAAPAGAAPHGPDLRIAPVDTVDFGEVVVRGMAWLDEERFVTLQVLPDTAAGLPPVSSRLVWHGPGGEAENEIDFTGTLARGLAFDGEFLWSCGDGEGGESLLYKIDADTLNVEAAFPTRGHRPCGVAWDGTYVWMVDRDSARFDRFDVELEEITRSVTTPGFSPSGLAFDGDRFWISDAGTGRLYRLSRNTGTWNGVVALEDWSFRGADVPLAWDGNHFWFVLPPGSQAVRAVFE